jgi:hypothetical protein
VASFEVSLEVHQLPEAEVRRGWIRIHEGRRQGIRAGQLLRIRGPSGDALRIVYGLPEGYRVGERSAQGDWICLDEPTRDAIGLQERSLGSVVTFSIQRASQPVRVLQWLRYALCHPEIALRIGSWFAFVSFFLGIISIVLGILSVVGYGFSGDRGLPAGTTELSLATFFRVDNPFLYLAIASALFFGVSSVFTFVQDEVRREQVWTWWVYQIWFNAVGAAAGWIAVYYLWNAGFNDFQWRHLAALLIAFFGITGNLPGMSMRLGEAIGRLFRPRE